MGTLIQLDGPRLACLEQSYASVVESKDIPCSQTTSSRVYKWKGRDGITLKPVNMSTDFTSTGKYDAFKFRLKDVVCNTDWWDEVPQFEDTNLPVVQTTNDPQGQGADWFFHAKVSSDNVPATPVYSSDWPLLQILSEAGSFIVREEVHRLSMQTINDVGVMYSSISFPANQGYHLRFFFDGREPNGFAGLLTFQFGDMGVRFHGNGDADIYQTRDGTAWQYWETFKFQSDRMVMGHFQSIIIYPHARDCIEFVFDFNNEPAVEGALPDGYETPSSRRSHVFRCKAPTINQDGNSWTITQPGPWYIYVSRQYRPQIQVSTLGFYTGNNLPNYPAVVTDNVRSFGYTPTMPLQTRATIDYSDRSRAAITLYSVRASNNSILGVIPVPFETGVDSSYVTQIQLVGDGSVPLPYPGASADTYPASVASPEFYGYQIYKQARFDTDSGLPVTVPILSVDIDYGDSPENETMSVAIDNSNGQVSQFQNRSYIPVQLFDEDTGIVYFEGIGYEPEFELSQQPLMRLHCHGMADALMTTNSLDLDFTVNPADGNGNAYPWQNALNACFEIGGFPESVVTFEGTSPNAQGEFTVPGSSYNFPLWNPTTTGKGTDPGSAEQRWRPSPKRPIYEFIDHMIRQIFGWHWEWGRKDGTWHIHKRPSPSEFLALSKLAKGGIKAGFFTTYEAMAAWQANNPLISYPLYAHRGQVWSTKRPQYTTTQNYGYFPRYSLVSGKELTDQLLNPTDEHSAAMPLLVAKDQLVCIEVNNPNGYQHPNAPAVDRTSPDYLRTKKIKPINLTLAADEVSFGWMVRRFAEDLIFGYETTAFTSDFGDGVTSYLRRWDPIIVDGVLCALDRIEPKWKGGEDGVKEARFSAWIFRQDAPLPR